MESPNHQIRISNIRWQGSQEQLEMELYKMFLPCGLIHQVVARSSPDMEQGQYYSYIKFYSVRSLRAALQLDGKLILGNESLRLRCGGQKGDKITLSLSNAQELLTYYFGFNCWTSDVVFMEREHECEEPDSIQHLCMVRVKMPKEELSSEGLGISKVPFDKNTPASRGVAFSCSQKFAMNAAMKSAFSKFVIITLSNGKVTVEVDTTIEDPLIYDPAWDKPLIQVNNITFDPDDEEQCKDLDDMTEEQLEEILNQPL